MEILLALGIAGAALFVTAVGIDGALRPGYHPMHHAISMLALGPGGWRQTATFIATGLLVLASSFGIYQAMGAFWVAPFAAVMGVGMVLSGIFPTDPMRGYPPGTPDRTPMNTSRSHEIHDWVGALVFTAFPAGAIAATFALEPLEWKIYSGASAVALIALLVMFNAAWAQDSPRAGLVQRLMALTGFLWLALVCAHLLVNGG